MVDKFTCAIYHHWRYICILSFIVYNHTHTHTHTHNDLIENVEQK